MYKRFASALLSFIHPFPSQRSLFGCPWGVLLSPGMHLWTASNVVYHSVFPAVGAYTSDSVSLHKFIKAAWQNACALPSPAPSPADNDGDSRAGIAHIEPLAALQNACCMR